jgi:hypothetical protein
VLLCDEGILEYYSWLLVRHGIEIERGSRWGAHITFIRGQCPPSPEAWGRDVGEVPFRYGNMIRWDNGRHAWLDVLSPALSDLRTAVGLPPKDRFHLALGRLRLPRSDVQTVADGNRIE